MVDPGIIKHFNPTFHTGYKCPDCGKEFSYIPQVTKHWQATHKIWDKEFSFQT